MDFRRVVLDLYHLKRIHVFLPSPALGAALKSRLSALPENTAASLDSIRYLERLLDCLAHFELASVPAAKGAMSSVKEHLSSASVPGNHLASIISCCCRLEMSAVAVHVVPLLKEAIWTMPPADIAKLAEALSAAGLDHRVQVDPKKYGAEKHQNQATPGDATHRLRGPLLLPYTSY